MKVKDLKGKFKAVATLDSYFVLENKEVIKTNMLEQLKEQGAKPYVKGDTIQAGNGQFFMLPKIAKKREGVVTFRSKDFTFEFDELKSYCDKPKASDMIENGFTTINIKKEKTTWILEKI